MANRMKEDEKHEKIIRNLLKIPENRRCINCNSLGPQYVCTNFSTFVCTTCSGIHREFTHRIKSVSMAKFTPQEVSALQGGGNASAREIYLKELDPQRGSLPNGSNVERLRNFIKHVYVDRRYTGERNSEKPPRAKMSETEDLSGNRSRGSPSPPYDDRPGPGGRSPGYEEGYRHSGTYRSPGRVDVVNDWRREDRFEGRSSDGGSKLGGGSPDSQRDSDMSSPPVVRPVREILGENVSPLRVIEPPKATACKSTVDSVHHQRTASSSSIASSDVNPAEIKVEASFIDFDSVPEPPKTSSVNNQVPADASSAQLTATANNDWANFDSVPQVNVHTPATSSSIESVLSELSIQAPAPGSSAPVPPLQASGARGLSFGSFFGNTNPTSVVPSGGAPTTSFGQPPPPMDAEVNLLANSAIPTGAQWSPANPQQQPLASGGIVQPVSQPVTAPAVGGSFSNKAWNPLAPNSDRPPVGQVGASILSMGQSDKSPAVGTSFGFPAGSSPEATSGGRKALPEDLFTMNYSYAPPMHGWYPRPPYVAGFQMQYNMPMAPPNLPRAPRSTNPFDVGNEPSVQESTFPSAALLHDALPKTGMPYGLRNFSPSTSMPHPSTMLAQSPSYPSAVPQGPFMGQELPHGMMAPRPQAPSGFGLGEPLFPTLNQNPNLSGMHSTHPTTNNFPSASGNPFG